MIKPKRAFRSDESFASERLSRAAVAPFLEARGIRVLSDDRKRVGLGESQVVAAVLPDGSQARLRVRLCWRRDGRDPNEGKFSALQLSARTIKGDWARTLTHVAQRDAEESIGYTLAFQRDGSKVALAALIPSDQLPAIWQRQREVSDQLGQNGLLGKRRRNHATNGDSPTLWLQDDRHPAAKAVADVLWGWPGVMDLVSLPPSSPGPASSKGAAPTPTQREYSSGELSGAIQAAQISAAGRRWLVAHYEAPNATASMESLAETLGYGGHRSGNALYGAVAHKIADALLPGVELGDQSKDQWMQWIATMAESDPRGHSQWELRPEVAEALLQLGWVSRQDWGEHVEPEFDAAAALAEARQFGLSDTETRQMLLSRRGQGRFRQEVMELWGGACAVTGLARQSLLVASHIKPWRTSDPNERLDRFNGLALSPNLDRAFDQGLITFDDEGRIEVSSQMSAAEMSLLGVSREMRLGRVSARSQAYLSYHRTSIFSR